MRTLALLTIAAVLTMGCASMHPEPEHLVFPDYPDITWKLCRTSFDTMICLSEPDASALAKWLEKVKSFEEARARLIRY